MILENSTILFFGGGRWARILILACINLKKKNWNIVVYTPRNSLGMQSWIDQNDLSEKVEVISDLTCIKNEIQAAIVVNAVKDHVSSINWALDQGIAVMVEKPMALNSVDLLFLLNKAKQQNVALVPAHIFLFCDYLDQFKEILVSEDEIETISIDWVDPKNEVRYSEGKTYDASLYVIADWLPHIMSILSMVIPTPILDTKFNELELQHGGAEVWLSLSSGNIPIQVSMAREGSARLRLLQIKSNTGKTYSINFTKEPGEIFVDGKLVKNETTWGQENRPTIKMVNSFLTLVESGKEDDALKVDIALKTCQLLDEMYPIYSKKRRKWLRDTNHLITDQAGIRYGLKEQRSVQLTNNKVIKWEEFVN